MRVGIDTQSTFGQRMGMKHFVLDMRTATARFPGIGRYVSGLTAAVPGQLADDEHLTFLVNAAGVAPSGDTHVSEVYVSGSPFSLSQHWVIPNLLRRMGAAVYHSPYLLMPLAVRAPTVLTVYDALPLQLPGHSTLRARVLFRLAMSLALQRADAVIAVSGAARADIAACFPAAAGRLRVQAPGVGAEFRPPDSASVEHVRRRYGLSDVFALYVGSDRPHKNLAALREAWSGMRAGAVLALAGVAGDATPDVLPLGRVPDEDLPALYGAATVAVQPSLGEGFGFPVLEAMACGTPVACSDIPALRELGGDAVAYFDPHRPDAIASALRDLMSNPARRCDMREAGLARAAAYTWTAAAAGTLAIYRRLYEESRE